MNHKAKSELTSVQSSRGAGSARGVPPAHYLFQRATRCHLSIRLAGGPRAAADTFIKRTLDNLQRQHKIVDFRAA